MKEQILHLENENTKLKEEFKEISSHLPLKQNEELTVNAKYNIKIEKNIIGSDSPETFEIIDKNMSVFRQSITTSDDNISNSSFNANEWINLNIPQTIPRDHVTSKINFENMLVTYLIYTINTITHF